MSFISDIVGGITGASDQADAAQQAADTQAGAARYGIDVNNANFQQIQQLLAPFVQAGTNALGQQQNILGTNGAGAQQAAYDAIKASPAYTSALQVGENSILQNASATGGLRGGNVQGALAQYSPALLSSLIQQQYGNLGGLTNLGQNAAAGVGTAGTNNANSVSTLANQAGSATAGGQLAAGNQTANTFNTLSSLAGFLF